MPWISSPPTLTGRIVELSPLHPDDAAELSKAVRDGDLHREWWTSTPSPDDMTADIAGKLVQAADGTMVPFVIRAATGGSALGVTCFYDLDPTVPRLEIGYTWLRASAQGTGANPEAKLLLLRYAFDELNCARVGIRTKFSNTTSRAAIERLGFKRDGVLRSHARLRNGTLDDAVLYSALEHEWPVIRSVLGNRVERHVSLN
ncbi:GNAT family N-acetyltransferase [Corynebacterium sp. CCM 9185]|uniref:GNAT family N-acetyltransferase n=1 Tax=Corynebacterium marambiense TaxID=2765364 RepID=A0ABS0VUY2_9CORY|nr:GNAT family protein [Corynebacterium marambiense]MBI9000124.1 GNAT family N-acetyltransferase [Corynebacterium marambiense]MCK7663478.1 GNAT family N-acetyltransferase [Corynebacterium marambiense]